MSKSVNRLISILLLGVLVFSCVPNVAFAAESNVIGQYYELDENGNIIESTGTDNPEKTLVDEKTGHYINYSKVISETDTPNEYSITFSIETTQKLDDIEVSNQADIVLVFDVSTSMDYMTDGTRPNQAGWSLENTRWAALKDAAKTFIKGLLGDDADSNHQVSIVVYGGMASSANTSIAHKTICDWTSSAEAAIATFDVYDVVCQTYAQAAYGVTNTTSLRRAYFNDASSSYGNTNCEAGFVGAIEQLDKLSGNTNQFVVYMSDGEANVSYTDAKSQSTGGGRTDVERDAIKMSGKLKADFPKCSLYTVGFGEATESTVLQTGEKNNPHIDRYYAAESASQLKSIYEEIYELIDMLSRSWQITDPIGSAYNLNNSSLTGTGDIAVGADGIIKWNLLGADYSDSYVDTSGNTVYIYNMTYTVKLDSHSEGFDLSTYYTANGITTLTYLFTYADGTINKESGGTGKFLIPTAKGAELSVTYKANGGTGSDVTDIIGWESDYTVRSSGNTGFSRTEYTLSGWNTKPDGSGSGYNAGQIVKGTSDLTLYAQWTYSGNYMLTYDPGVGHGSRYTTQVNNGGSHKVLSNEDIGFINTGYKVDSWNTKADGTGTGYREGAEITGITEDIVLYAQWVIELNTDDHVAYVIGYENGTVKPENNITRAEVATIFFRLLSDNARSNFWKNTNDFTDVARNTWYNNAVSTMANARIITGYSNKTFRGNNNITRAEFAAIAARFDSGSYIGTDKFTDISGHWAGEYINRAAERGWITGYKDGTFKPNEYITRAEAMTLFNRVLGRDNIGSMHADMKKWSDNQSNKWYYEAVQEATNSHEYVRDGNGYENWTKVVPPPDWAALEKQWSAVNE